MPDRSSFWDGPSAIRNGNLRRRDQHDAPVASFSHWEHHDSLQACPPQDLLPVTWQGWTRDLQPTPEAEAPSIQAAAVVEEVIPPGTQLEQRALPGVAWTLEPLAELTQVPYQPPVQPVTVQAPPAEASEMSPRPRPARSRGPWLLRVTLAVSLLVATSVSLRRADQTPVASELAGLPAAAAADAAASPVQSCRVRQNVAARSQGRVTTVLTIVNSGRSAVQGWTLRWTYPGTSPQQMPLLSNGWNAAVSVDAFGGQAIDVDPSRVIPAGGSVTIGFVGTRPGDRPGTVPRPSEFALNGVVCR